MVAEYTIKMNGKWYHAGDELPSPAESFAENTEKTAKEPKKLSYNKTEINRMSTAELKALAKSTGFDGGEDMTGSELKQYFISLFGL